MNFELKNENSFRFDDEKQQNQISPNNQQAEPQIDYLMRLGFIRKVYGILSCQILITVIICGFTFNDNFRSFLSTNTYLFWMCLGIGLFTIFPLICCKEFSRRVPINYILLVVWTICQSYMVATCCSFYDKNVVMTSAILTLGATIALTLYAFSTKDDFTFLGGMLFIVSVLLLLSVILSIFFRSFINTLYCFLCVFAYSIYLVYDTQLLLGNLGISYEIDDYIIASLNIHLDIIQIFLSILQLLGNKK